MGKGALDTPAQYRQLAVWTTRARASAGLGDLKASMARAVRANPTLTGALDAQSLESVRIFVEAGEPTDLSGRAEHNAARAGSGGEVR